MHPLYIKSINTLPISFVLFPISLGKCLSLAMLTTCKTCNGIKLYICLDKQIGPKVQGVAFYLITSWGRTTLSSDICYWFLFVTRRLKMKCSGLFSLKVETNKRLHFTDKQPERVKVLRIHFIVSH